MKNQKYPIIIICIIVVFCSSCSITRQTTCPTFTNKIEKKHKPFFSKKQSLRKDKKQLAKIADQTKKGNTKNKSFARIENIISKIEMNDIMALSDNDIALNSSDIAPTFIESKVQKFIYKKIEKKSKKARKNLEKQDQEKDVKKTREQIVSKKKHKKKRKKIFNSKDNAPTDKPELHDLAILSMLAGILIFITPFFSILMGGWFLVPAILLIIFAIDWGKKGRKQIKKNPSKYKGEGMALTGFILGLVALGILLSIITLSLYFAAIYS